MAKAFDRIARARGGATDENGESKPFIEHLEDLRRCLVQVVLALGLGVLVATPFAPLIMRIITHPLQSAAGSADPFLRTLDVTGAFTLWMRVAVWSGLVIALPGVLYAVAHFVLPGLTDREKAALRQYGGFGVLLFALGVYLGYRALPLALKAMMMFSDWMGVRPEWTATSYVPFAMQILLAFGLVFELPVVLLILGRLGLVHVAFLREKRRHVYVLVFILAAVLTPPEVISQVVMALALIGLYEGCIVLMAVRERRDAAARAGTAQP